MQSRFSLHLCQGSCLPCAPLHFLLPAAAGSPAHLLTRSSAGTSAPAKREQTDPVLVLVLVVHIFCPLMCATRLTSSPAAWALGARIQPPSIQSVLPCRHVIPKANHLWLCHPCSRHHKTCHPMPIPSTVARWPSGASQTACYCASGHQASRGHTICLGQFQKYYPARTCIRHPDMHPPTHARR